MFSFTTGYTYADPESRLTDITYPSGTIGNVHYAYDSYGRRSQMTDGTGGQTYAYDDDDALTTKNVTWTGFSAKTVSYGFYANGSRKSMNADGRSFSYGYDGDGRMNSLVNPSNQQSSWTYQDNGWLQAKNLVNGITTTYTRDAQGRLTDLLNSQNGTLLSEFRIPATGGYDGVGNRLSVTANVPGTQHTVASAYQYDYGQTQSPQASRSQLTQETTTLLGGDYSTANYAYDGGTSGGPGNPTSFGYFNNTFNADNQITGSGYGYDGNGDATTYTQPSTQQSHSLTFDPENRLTSYDSTQTNGYDGDGLRTWVQPSGGGHYYYLYDGSQPVGEYNSSGALAATNTFGVDGLVSRYTGRFTMYTFDERGNVCQRLSTKGTSSSVSSTDSYNAYGNRSSNTAQPDPFGYGGQAGYYTDAETGLILCTHRFYDPSTGRWLTRDPLGYDGGVNLYGYCKNSPIVWSDPLGLLTQGAIFGGIVGTITSGIIAIAVIGAIGATGGAAIPVIIGVAILSGVAGNALGGATTAAIDGKPVGQGAIDGAEAGGIKGGIGGLFTCLGKMLPKA